MIEDSVHYRGKSTFSMVMQAICPMLLEDLGCQDEQ